MFSSKKKSCVWVDNCAMMATSHKVGSNKAQMGQPELRRSLEFAMTRFLTFSPLVAQQHVTGRPVSSNPRNDNLVGISEKWIFRIMTNYILKLNPNLREHGTHPNQNFHVGMDLKISLRSGTIGPRTPFGLELLHPGPSKPAHVAAGCHSTTIWAANRFSQPLCSKPWVAEETFQLGTDSSCHCHFGHPPPFGCKRAHYAPFRVFLFGMGPLLSLLIYPISYVYLESKLT